MYYLEFSSPDPAANLAIDDLLLDQCDHDHEVGFLRIWQSPRPFVVLGRGNRIQDEVRVGACQRDDVPILRRASGGGTVLQGPGCWNYSLIQRIDSAAAFQSVTETNRFIMERHAALLSRLLETPVRVQGHTDLTIGDRKCSGNAQRRTRNAFLFHGTFLLDFDLPMIEAYLKPPPRQPDYRASRTHEHFLTNLPLDPTTLTTALRLEWQATIPAEPPDSAALARLITERFTNSAWTESR